MASTFANKDLYQQVADEAIRYYPYDGAEAKLLAFSENATYVLRDPQSHEPYGVLRIGRPGYHTIEEIERTGACEKAGRMADRLTAGIRASAEKYDLPFVIFNQGSICHVDTVGTMHFAIDWSKPWQLPKILKETSRRQKEMEYMGAAYMAEGIVTLAGSRLYTSAAYDEEMIDDVISRVDRVFDKCGKLE